DTDTQLKDDGVRPIICSAIIAQLKDPKGNVDRKRKIIKSLLRYLPFLRVIEKFNETPIKDKKNLTQTQISEIEKRIEYALSPEGVADALCYYAELLYSLRDYYTHHFHAPAAFRILDKNGNDKYQNRVNQYMNNLNNIWTYNLRLLKQRFGYNETTAMLHLRKKVGKNENPKFTCRFFTKDEKNVTVFTERGLAFFASLFLEPKYIALMFAKLDQPEGRNTQQAVVTLKAYQTTTIRLPKNRMQTADETTPETLGMDALVELHKCPVELFGLLSKENQERFRINIGENNDIDDERLFKRQSLRQENRFVTLALNYLDRTNKFDGMGFHIDLGNYFFDCYEKGLIDGTQTHERRLGKRILTFQRIQDAVRDYKKNREKPEGKYWEPKENATPPKEYRQDMMPQYRIKRQQIGLYFNALHQGPPTIELNGKNTHNPKPDCWLSLHELPLLTFLAVIGKAKEAQELLCGLRQRWNKFLQKIIDGEKIVFQNDQQFYQDYNFKFNNLPDELKHFIKTGTVRTSDIQQKMIVALEQMRLGTEKLLQSFLKDNKFDAKPGKSPKRYNSGNIAKILAEDLMKLQRPNPDKVHQGKLTSPNFQALQANIAIFNQSKNELPDIFKRAGLINNPVYPHPFLNELVNKSDLISLPHFFEKYLKRKIQFLNDAITSQDFTNVHLVFRLQRQYERKQENLFIKNFAEKLLAEPMNLPRGLFAELIENAVKEKFSPQFAELPKRTFQQDGKTIQLPNNSTFLIQKYHEWSGDAMQWFYDLPWDGNSTPFKRIGRLFSTKNVDKNPFNVTDLQSQYGNIIKKLNAEKKTLKADTQERLTLRINSLDKFLKQYRQSKLQDIVLFYIFRELLGGQIGQVKLSDITEQKIGDDADNRYLLEQERELELTYTIADQPPSIDKNINRTVNLPFTLSGKMKVKNYGNFRRLTNDIRIPSLLRLLHAANKTDRFGYQQLQDDFDKYEEVRLFVFQKVHELEQTVIAKLPSLKFDADGKAKEYVDFSTVVSALSHIPTQKQIALSILRNSFAHHYYPEFVYESKDGEDQDVAKFNTMMLERQFRNQLIGKPLPERLKDGKPATMANRVLKLAKQLFDDVIKQVDAIKQVGELREMR
ncbi:MAG: type VI-B CRISPR-associated RNA-guided ribonuclease Cas13b, partial [Planctomycetaceae bacterium]|nr:type VI-B CRISPR-associated RNA-guided ribonuclease Cas13b [Planctomycetaceae bacterium]